jgi:hypothetical protein
MRWLTFPEWPKTDDRRIFSTDWAWEVDRLSRVKRFFAVYEDRGNYKTIAVTAVQTVSFNVLPTAPSSTVQEIPFEPRMENPDKAYERIVKWCDFLQKGAL